MDFDYRQFEPGHFDIVWASPECKMFSSLQHTNIGVNRKWKTIDELHQARLGHHKYVLRVLEMIEYLKPKMWFIENPWNSAMKDIPQMKDLPSFRFDYCRFGFPYNKPTRIWTNRTDMENHVCECENKKHPFRIGISSPKLQRKGETNDKTNQDIRYRIPERLLEYLFQSSSLSSR